MKRKLIAYVFPLLFVSTAVFVFVSPSQAISFTNFDEQVSYCAWKYQYYCEEWEHENDFHPNKPPAGGFRNFAPECYQNGLDLKDGLDICLAYEDY